MYPFLPSVADVLMVYSWFSEAYNMIKERGLEVDSGMLLTQWLNKCPVFENIVSTKIHTPVGPWMKCTFISLSPSLPLSPPLT